jgi:hypothetical protein
MTTGNRDTSVTVLDKIDNLAWKFNEEVFINPHNNEPYVITDHIREGFYLTGIIIHEDLSVEFMAKKCPKVVMFHKEEMQT